jgi:hypothetical protein
VLAAAVALEAVLADVEAAEAAVAEAAVAEAAVAGAGPASPVRARIPVMPLAASHAGRAAARELHRLFLARLFVFNSLAPRSGFYI